MATQSRPQWHREYLWRELWTERQLLDVLCGRDPDAAAESHDEAIRRAEDHERARDNVDVAIRAGDLVVEWTRVEAIERAIEAVDPALAQAVRRAAIPMQIYGRGYYVRPLSAIRWATKTPERFPECPFTADDVAALVARLVEHGGAAEAPPGTDTLGADVSVAGRAELRSVDDDVRSLADRRREMLEEYTVATGERIKAKIYRAADVHKPEFYKWLNGTLSTASETSRRLERFLVARQPIKSRSTGELP